MEATGTNIENKPEKPFSTLTTIFFASDDKKRYFRQNSPTGGTYLECWASGKEFAHILATTELGTPEKLKAWMDQKGMRPSTWETYDEYFFQLCREVEAKRSRKNDERQKLFDQKATNLATA